MKRRFSAGVIPYYKARDEIRFLILRAYRHWDFPKGLVENGELPLAAAVRELEEETSLKKVRLHNAENYFETEIYAGGKIVRFYLGEVAKDDFTRPLILPVNPELGHPEHHEYRWATYDEAIQLFVPRLQKALTWARENI